MIKWKKCKLGDVVNFKRGYDLPRSKMKEGIYPVIGSNGIIGYHNEYTTEKPSITIGRSGNVGNPFLINNKSWSHNTTLYIDKFKNTDPFFIYYYLHIIDLKRQSGGSTVPTLNRNFIHSIEINIPEDINEQKKIGSCLKNIDDLIQLKQQANSEMYKFIQTIFNFWFFELEFPNENNEPYKSSGGDIIWCDELNMEIPKKWTIDFLGSDLSSSIIKPGIEKFNNNKTYIATADVIDFDIVNFENNVTMENKPIRANMQPIEKSVWFAKMVDSKKVLVVDNYENLIEKYIFSTGFLGLSCPELYFYYIASFVLNDNFEMIKNHLCAGSTMRAIKNDNVKFIKFSLPEQEILNKYNKIIKPIFDNI